MASALASGDPAVDQAVRDLDAIYQASSTQHGTLAALSAEVGDLWSRLEAYPEACAAYDRALRLAPGVTAYRFNRAAVRAFLGDMQGAEDDYDRVLLESPTDGQAYLNRSQLRRQRVDRNHVDALRHALVAAGSDWKRAVPLHYALAKEYADLGEHDRAAVELGFGARLRRAHLQYDVQRDLDTVNWIRKAYPTVYPAPSPTLTRSAADARPLFVVSLPRTGSTLVDRMLSSHPDVRSTGERPEFAAALVAEVQRQRGTALSREALVRESARIDFPMLGAAYRYRMRRFIGNARHFTDKMPLNYLYCGLIARALPDARIVHVHRGPLATIHAIHRMLFEQGYPFAYDLDELTAYYIGYRRLMAHWRDVLPGRLVEVSYEALVRAPDTEVRRLLSELDLPFDSACLAFDRNPRPTSTASASQVRQPLYTDAVANWRPYAALLEPVRIRLQQAGIRTEAD